MERLREWVVSDPETMHGAPCFRGTRVPAELLWRDLRSGRTIDEFLEACPSVTREQVEQYLAVAHEILLEGATRSPELQRDSG